MILWISSNQVNKMTRVASLFYACHVHHSVNRPKPTMKQLNTNLTRAASKYLNLGRENYSRPTRPIFCFDSLDLLHFFCKEIITKAVRFL